MTLTREELYELVWSRPMYKLAAEFGLSDVGLAKICKAEGIPRPERGYWARLAAGAKVRRRRLPPSKNPTRGPLAFRRVLAPGEAPPEPPVVDVPERLKNPHAAVAALQQGIQEGEVDAYGRLVVGDKYCQAFCVGPRHRGEGCKDLGCPVQGTDGPRA